MKKKYSICSGVDIKQMNSLNWIKLNKFVTKLQNKILFRKIKVNSI